MCVMGGPLLPVDGLPEPDEASALLLQDVVSPHEPAPQGAITTRKERFVSTAALNQRLYWASGRHIAGDGGIHLWHSRQPWRPFSGVTSVRPSRIDLGLPALCGLPAKAGGMSGCDTRPVRRWGADHAVFWLCGPRVQCLPRPPSEFLGPLHAGQRPVTECQHIRSRGLLRDSVCARLEMIQLHQLAGSLPADPARRLADPQTVWAGRA
jgi:hypothetical protein